MNTDKAAAIAHMRDIINVFRLVDRGMPAGAAEAFLFVAASDDEPSIAEIGRGCKMAHSTAYRYVHSLTKKGAGRRPGVDLVAIERHPESNRQKVVRPTARGLLLLSQLAAVLKNRPVSSTNIVRPM